MHGFSIKGTKEQKCWIKIIQDLRGLVKVFESVNSTIFPDMLGNWGKIYIWGL